MQDIMKGIIYFILPTYNESKSIFYLLEDINSLKVDLDKNIICLVINDASSDDTDLWIKKSKKAFNNIKILELKHKINLGLNNALNSGLNLLSKRILDQDIVITMDGDNTHDPQLISKMIDKHQLGDDLVIASRFLKDSKVTGVSGFRSILSHGARLLYKLFWGFKGINEYTCLYRSYKASLIIKFMEKYKYPYLKQKGFACTSEFLSKLITLEPKTSEVPMILNYDKKITGSKIKLFLTILMTLKILLFKQSK